MAFIKTWQFITLLLASFSLSLSMTHLLELPQRMQFDQQLWVKVTLIENVYKLFGDHKVKLLELVTKLGYDAKLSGG
jgi:uncharacterized membrane protein